MKRLNPEQILELAMSGASLGLIVFAATGAFSQRTLGELRDRAKRKHGCVASEESGKRSLGIPLDGSHNNHYEGQHHPDYNQPRNGRLLTIYEHLREHQQARPLPDNPDMLDNGLSVEGNLRAIEFMQTTIAVFEALLYQKERRIDDLIEKFEEEGALSPSITLKRIERVVDESIQRFDYLRDFSHKQRKDLITIVERHKREMQFRFDTHVQDPLYQAVR